MDLTKIKDLKDLQALLDLMGRYDLAELELEGEGQKIRLRKAVQILGQAAAPGVGLPAAGMAAPALGVQEGAAAARGAGAASPAAAQAGRPSNVREVVSPMVGTFYRASSPEAEPFAKEGDLVEPETVLCIIEAMKVMNEIPAGVAGVIREILIKNGESVEFGQPLFLIETE